MLRRLDVLFAGLPALVLLICLAGTACAFDPNSPAPVNTGSSGVAVAGHDPVAYFVEGRPVEGSAEITASHEGADYRFASAANRDAFLAEPERYLPQYGGFCALAMSFGKKVDIDPNAWKIVDDKLYVQANPRAATVWQYDIPGNIGKANGHWPTVMDKAPSDL